MAKDIRWAAEVAWQDIGIANAADPWRARSESRSEASWLSASILHDLRNPVGTIYAGAEMLMTLDTTPNQVKRLAANIHRAASRMRELLIDLASATYGNRSTPEICDIREIIAAASEAAAARDGEVRIGATRNRDYVPVAIEDTGPGIPHEIRDKVFEPF